MLFMNIKIEKYDLNLIIQTIYELFGSFLINFEICENELKIDILKRKVFTKITQFYIQFLIIICQ